MFRRLTVVVATALILAGCGGGGGNTTQSTTTKTTLTPKLEQHSVTSPTGVHPCTASDAVMQCFLTKPPTSLPPVQRTAIAPIFGVDFGWGGPSCAALKSQGRIFGESYLSTDSSKNWQHAQVIDYLHNGCKVGFVWETSANRALDGRDAGIADARAALGQYRTYVPSGRVAINFAIDFDATGPDVAPYFSGVHSVLGDGGGAYGGAGPLVYLCDHHLVGHTNWSTYAWLYRNNNQFPPVSCAPLEQYLNDTSVDFDRALAPDYGQTPAPSPAPVQVRCFRKGWQHTHFCNNVRAQTLHYGARYRKEQGYLKVSQRHQASVLHESKVLLNRFKQVENRAATELAKHQWKSLIISAQTADKLEPRIAPIKARLAAIQANVNRETAAAKTALAKEQALLHKYGYYN